MKSVLLTATAVFALSLGSTHAASPSAPLTVIVTPAGSTRCTSAPCPGSILPAGTSGWVVGFDEEFPGTSIDTSVWNVPPDGSNFPSGQIEHCSAYLHVNNGTLSITSPGTYGDSCAINTIATFGFGYYEANVWTGNWPADWSVFWILSNGNSSCAPIDSGFEADIIETYNTSEQNVYWSGYANCFQGWHGGGNGKVGDTYHVYGLDVETSGFTFYVDGVQTAHFAQALSSNDTLNESIILQNIFQSSVTQGLKAHWVRFYHH